MTDQDVTSLGQRLSLMDIDDAMRATLRDMQPLISRSVVAALTIFYDKVRNTPAVARFFSGEEHITSAKNRQIDH